jgi:5'-nucleotidase
VLVVASGVAAAQDTGLFDRGTAVSEEATVVWIGDTDSAGADRALVRMARERGYQIRLVADDALAADPATEDPGGEADPLAGADLVVVGSTADAALVEVLAGADLPVLALDPSSYSALGLARSAGLAATPTTELRIRPDAFGHPLLAGLIYEPQILHQPAPLNTGFPGRGATVLAREGGTRRPSLFAYEAGAPLVDGTAAPAARVAFPYGPAGAPELTRAGRALFGAALSWLSQQNVVAIQLLAVNDIHGQLDGIGRVRDAGGAVTAAGGAAHLGALVTAARAANPNTLFLSGGSLLGESATLATAGNEDPTVSAYDAMTLDLAVVGAGELSLGREELNRLAGRARFHLLAANLVDDATGEALFPAYATQSFAGVDVAVIGVVPTDVSGQLPAGALDGLRVDDPVVVVNTLVDHLKNDQGVEVVVVAVHLGGRRDPADPEACPGLVGALGQLVNTSSSRVDAYVTGRTSRAYVCDFTGRPVTAAAPYGRGLTTVELRFDRRSGLLETAAENVAVTAAGDADPAVSEVIASHQESLAPALAAVVGSVLADISLERTLAGEMPVGSVVADARLSATSAAETGGAQVALVASGRVRAPLEREPSGQEPRGRVTLAEAGAVVPLNDRLLTVSLTGAQLEAVLEQQWSSASSSPRLFQVAGLTYRYDPLAPAGERVDPAAVLVAGAPLDLVATYRVTVDRALLQADRFPALREATDAVVGPTDRAALLAYLDANRRLAPPAGGRILALATPGG